ncbi:hypothetical protein Chor_006477 [Crotalus horridus]
MRLRCPGEVKVTFSGLRLVRPTLEGGDERSYDCTTPAEAQTQAGMEAGGRGSPCCQTCSVIQLKKIFWGVVVVLGVCSSWECCRFFGDNGLTLKAFFTKAAPFGVLWTLTNYLYLHAIKKINTTDVSVLFCCNKAFVFLLSWIVLRDRFMGVRIVAAILAIAGIVMMTYADGFHSHSVIGIALIVGSASTSALYKVICPKGEVLFKLLLGSAKYGEAALFLSVLAIFNILFVTCIPVILYFTKVEYWSSFDAIPWGSICGFSVLLLIVDHYSSDIVFNSVRVIAIVIIGLGFLLLLLPEEWDEWLIKLLTRLKVRKKEEIPEGNGDIVSGLQNKNRVLLKFTKKSRSAYFKLLITRTADHLRTTTSSVAARFTSHLHRSGDAPDLYFCEERIKPYT